MLPHAEIHSPCRDPLPHAGIHYPMQGSNSLFFEGTWTLQSYVKVYPITSEGMWIHVARGEEF